MKLPVNEIICDHNIRAMRKFPDNSIDSILTDPPYGLGFMGKDWDTFKNAKDKADESLEGNIKAQRHRRDGRLLADNGLGSLAQKAGLYDFSRNAEFQKWFTKWAKECLRVAKPGAFMFVFGGTRTFHRLTCAIEDAGWQIRDCLMWLYGSGFPKSLDISKAIDKAKGVKRKVVGKGKGAGTKGNTFPLEREYDDTIPTSKLAKFWDGYGTALKPSWEPIIIAMKPVDDNFAKNAEKWSVAGLNIDGGRIGQGTGEVKNYKVVDMRGGNYGQGEEAYRDREKLEYESIDKGRWPANLILDEEAAAMLDEQSGELSSGVAIRHNKGVSGRGWKSIGYPESKEDVGYADSGGASRFFYIAKASRGERNAGCSGIEEKRPDTRSDIDKGIWVEKGTAKQSNFHPTVKPLSLMKYLCMLLKMPNPDQIILDPFVGSGTTCIACKELGINYIGIDKDEDYCKITRARLKNVRLTLFEKPVKKTKKKVRKRLL